MTVHVNGVEVDDWLPHTCDHPPEVATCAGCKQRDELHVQPISQRVRDDQKRRELVADVRYEQFWLDGAWLSVCERCGAVVLTGTGDRSKVLGAQPSRDMHTAWHVKLNEVLTPVARGVIL